MPLPGQCGGGRIRLGSSVGGSMPIAHHQAPEGGSAFSPWRSMPRAA